MCRNEAEPSLEALHRDIIVRLAAATGNLRMLEVGAPFAADLIGLAQTQVEAALSSARRAEEMRAKAIGVLATHHRRGGVRRR